MHFNPDKILDVYKQSNWRQRFDMFCFYRELRTEMTEIDKRSKDAICLIKQIKLNINKER